MQLQLRYITQHYTTLIPLHYATATATTAAATTIVTTTTSHYTTLQLQLHYLPLHYTRLHYTIPHYSTQHYSTLQYTTVITPHHSYNCNCNYTTLNSATPPCNYNYNCITPRYIQQLWVRWPLQPLQPPQKNTASTTFRPISGFSRPSVLHNNQPLL